jgi:hypothetical protein
MMVELNLAKAQDIASLSQAYKTLDKAGFDKFMASGVVVEIKDLSGHSFVNGFMVSDGLSQETIDALKKDIKRTYDLRLSCSKIGDTK